MFPSYVQTCLNTLRGAGFEAYPVGGCVRDTLLGRMPGDWDVTTSALPEETLALFEKAIPTGIQHGTITVVLEEKTIEVTTFRAEEGYADGRHPDKVRFGVGLEADLARRDFTVNAMAFGVNGEVIDPFGGQRDLRDGILRTVGEPERRFREDALRILRAVRFSAQLNFVIDPQTGAAMEEQAHRLIHVSGERIVTELEKTLLSAHPERVGEFFRLGAVERFGCRIRESDWSALKQTVSETGERWRKLCRLTGLDITALPVSRVIRRAVLKPNAGKEKLLALSGGELAGLGLQGEEIGKVQKFLVEWVLSHPEDNEPEKLLRLLRKNDMLR